MMHIKISISDVPKFHFAVFTKWFRLIVELRVNSVLLDLPPFLDEAFALGNFRISFKSVLNYNALDIRPPIRTGFMG